MPALLSVRPPFLSEEAVMWKRSFILAILFVLASAIILFAATTPIDFTGFDGSGFAPSPAAGQLDSDIWRVTGLSDGDGTFGGTYTTGDFARGTSTGGVNTGGVYSFNVGGGNATLGVQPGGSDFTPGDFTLKIENTTGNTVADVYVSYIIWTYNDKDRSNSLNFSWSLDDVTYTSVPALDYTTPGTADTTPTWTSVSRSTTLSGVNLPAGGFLYLKWTGDDVSGSGNRDEYAIDDIEARIGGPNAVSFTAMSTSNGPGSGPIIALLVGFSLLLFLGFWLRRRSHS